MPPDHGGAAVRTVLRDDARTRMEFLELIRRRNGVELAPVSQNTRFKHVGVMWSRALSVARTDELIRRFSRKHAGFFNVRLKRTI
jgi:hypothetical protein